MYVQTWKGFMVIIGLLRCAFLLLHKFSLFYNVSNLWMKNALIDEYIDTLIISSRLWLRIGAFSCTDASLFIIDLFRLCQKCNLDKTTEF